MDRQNADQSWDWQGDDYYLQEDPQLDMSASLWNDQNEDDVLFMLEETTPVKSCTEMDFHSFDSGEKLNEESERFRDSSQLKRRRMLQFDTDEQLPSAFVKSEDKEESSMKDDLPADDLQWGSCFPDELISLDKTDLYPSSEGWLGNCFYDNEMQISSDEMTVSGLSDCQIDISEFCNIQQETRTEITQHSPAPRSRCVFRAGRKSSVQTPAKLTTSVAYPFALIKPCDAQGDVTLKDINRRIQTPPPKPKAKEEDEFASYPTSAFSGKPVVVKTKIRTEGGKGSITIMRTKG